MAAKQIMYSDDARQKIKKGIEILAKTVKTTLGATGRNVMFEKGFGAPTVTKDGVTVAKEVEVADPFENMGVKMVKEIASKTSDVAGDGTTTATVLAEAIYSEGLKYVTGGMNPQTLREGINKAVEAAVEALKKMSKPVKTRDEMKNVAAISANNDMSIGEILAHAMEKIGKDGVITVEEAKSIDTTLDLVEGMQFDKGFISPYFMTNPENMAAELEDARILIHEKKISNVRELVPILEKIAGTGSPILIIAEDVESEALAALVVNKLRGVLRCVAVKAPGFGDRRKMMMQDIAILTGGKMISEDLGLKLESIEIEDLGTAKRITVDKDTTTIVEGGGKTSDIKARISQIRTQIEKTTSDYDREKLEERLAKLVGGVAVVNVGDATEAAMKTKKALVEDALHATRAAAEEGIVPGGGIALLRAASSVQEVRSKVKGEAKAGVDIILKAMETPIRQIAENSGYDGAVIASDAREKAHDIGFDANTGKFVDMFKSGIVDPTKVVRVALQNAASIASLLLTTETMVTDLKEDEEAVVGSVS